MTDVCFYFQVHQPYRIKKYSVFQVGADHEYFQHQEQDSKLNNRGVLRKVAEKSYLPATRLWHGLLKRHRELRLSFSFSGVILDQFERWAPEVLELFQAVAATKQVEILGETDDHSLASLHSTEEFASQCLLHALKVKRLFGAIPRVFRNTELIYNNHIAELVGKLGFRGILAEGADHVLGWRSPNYLYASTGNPSVSLLLKNYRLSDDIAFRFSERSWSEWPLTAPKFASWVAEASRAGAEVVNLFMDYETFGEHQWESTGIFKFLERLPEELLKYPEISFATPSEVFDRLSPVGRIDAREPFSWADIDRGVSAWMGNELQQSALQSVYGLEPRVLESGDPELLGTWRLLQTSDHFYYMCTKWFADGDVHAYFNPYDSPYDAYISYMNVLSDFRLRLEEAEKVKVSNHKSQITNKSQ